METCPPGHVLVVDSRGDARAASAGDLYVGRLKARGCAGIVTDGGLRDTDGIFKTGLPAYHRRASSPPSPIAHHPCDLDLPIACGGVAVYPGDIIVGDCDGVVVIPPDIVDEVAEEALATTLYEEFAEEEVARGRALPGLFPAAGDEVRKRRFRSVEEDARDLTRIRHTVAGCRRRNEVSPRGTSICRGAIYA